ncbi:MAG: TonB-dependent receptor [Tannerellaceae bacterium]|nr:TonB-dependent receptor [Tannerellaceae bacterium]
MKATLFISFVCVFQLMAINTDAQNTVIDLKTEKITIKDLIRAIEQQTEYLVVYSHSEVDTAKEIQLKNKSAPVKDYLNEALSGTDIDYVFNNDYIILKSRQINLSEITPSIIVTQQNGKRITGIVTDAGGEPLIGANIRIKDANKGTITDIDGKFSLETERGQTLIVSYIGFITKSITVTDQHYLTVQLASDQRVIEEVVITGYGVAMKKPTMTGAIAAIRDEDLARSSAVNTSGSLAGKIAGVNFRQDDGRPGGTTMINIRNMGTPLYVIDGVQQNEGQFNNIDYNDIENITILKDASAAIYGLQAANGVMVVTTKKGSLKSRNTVSINARYGWQDFMEFPRPADAKTYVRSVMQSDVITGSKSPQYTVDEYNKWMEGKEKGYRPFDWYDYIFDGGPMYYVGANVSGGTDKVNYYMAISNTTQESVVVNYGNFNRTNVHLSVDANISDRFKMGSTISGRIEQKKNPSVPGDDIKSPFLALYRNLPTIGPYANDNPKYPSKPSLSYSDTNFAMLNYELSGKAEETFRVVQVNYNAEYELFKGMKAKGLVSYFYSQKYADNQEYTYKLYGYDEAADTYPVVFSMDNPFKNRNVYRKEEIKAQIQLIYEKNVGDHYINAVGAAESFKKDNPEFTIHSIPLSNALDLFDYETIDKFDDRENRTEARIGYVGRINYNYAQKYLLELAMRYDGSWKFPPNDRWGFFPSASIGWRISEETFWKQSPLPEVFSDLKIRASYGLLGDDNVSGYSAFDYMDGYNYYQTGAVLDDKYLYGAQPRSLPVITLSWIKAKIFDTGIDFGFFDNRLSGSLDYFTRKRTGLPASRYDVLLPSEVGFSLPKENLDSDMDKGFDGSLIWRDYKGVLKYSIGGNFSYSRAYNWHQYKPRFGNSWHEYRNSSYERYKNITWGLEAIGQFQSWDEIENYTIDNDRKGNTSLRPGDIKYKDVNGDNVINDMDQRPVGYREGSLPFLNYGLNFQFQWKNFDLALDFSGSSFNTWTQDRELRMPYQNSCNSPQFTLGNQWHLEDPTDPDSRLIPGKYPTMLKGNSSHSNYWGSTFWIYNVHYIKLKNFELGYNLPANWLDKIGMTACRLYVSGQNLFYLTNVEGIDPEITSNSAIIYPTTRVFNVGANIKF